MDLGTIKKLSKVEQKFKIKIPLYIQNKKGREKFPKNPKKKNVRLFFPSTHLSTDELTFTSRSR